MRKTSLILIFNICLLPIYAGDLDNSFIAALKNLQPIASTVPGNGDVNPYGLAIVPRTAGSLFENSILVSNFNDARNLQGTGTTIDQISPNGDVKVFAQISAASVPDCTGGIGLTTALVALQAGFVIVGSLPTTNGMAATAKAGCLIVLDSNGKPVATLAGNGINGPWDMTALDLGRFVVLFVTNVLNGTVQAGGATVNEGTVLRILLVFDGAQDTPRELARTVIASGFGQRTDPNALVIGPTGVGLGVDGTLYVADTLSNRIAAIPEALFRSTSAGTGNTVSQGGALNGPLGVTIAPGGDILTVNSGDGNMVELTAKGQQVSVKNVDATLTGAGTLFGLAIAPSQSGVYFVNDGNNKLYLLH